MQNKVNKKISDKQGFRASMHWHYFQICRDNLRAYEDVEKEIENYKNSGEEEHINQMNIAAAYSRRERHVVIPIVFAAMCLEAFIYDYGSRNLSGAFVRDHLDRLELPSKFVVLTELIVGNRFPTESQAYERLKKLVKDRNELVHFKSKQFSMDELEKLAKWHEEMNNRLKEAMYNAYDAVISVMKEIDQLHDNSTNYYLIYTTDAECHA